MSDMVIRTLPSGTVTLLFTDIVGSTRLLYELGDHYRGALDDHRRLVRAAAAHHGGVEVDTQGDAFFVAFAKASDAVAAAAAIQDAHSPEQGSRIQLRIGIHSGEPTPTDEGYVGLDVHRAARISAAAHAGQTVVSQTTRDLVGEDRMRDLGMHRLKDVGELRLYQLGDGTFPPLKSLNGTNVPLPPAPLVGRKRELADLLRLIRVDRTRLLTITGPGGVGKTRLALEAAAELADSFADGVWFVDLSAVREPELVESTIASAIGAGGELAEHIGDRETLLVLDNFEQVTGAAPDVGRLLDSSARLAVVATSREPLRLRREVEYALFPLAEAPAVELFRQRAEAIRPAFEGDYQRLNELCVRLERIPLAIELAAARVKILTPEQLLDRLDRRLPLLTGGGRDAPARQRTLRATIEWSYELLEEDERRLFERLAVFVGGWTLDAAEEICSADLDTLQSLVDKSLARADDTRFRMLETIREFATERFADSAASGEIRHRHGMYYLALAERAEPELTGGEQPIWIERIAADYENLRGALEWFAASRASEQGLRLAKSLSLFWFLGGLYHDGLHWLERMLDASAPATDARAGALWGAGFLHTLVGNVERAEEVTQEALALARTSGDDSLAARCLLVLGLLSFFRNDIQRARSHFEHGAELARAADDRWCLADALGTLSSIYPLQAEIDLAESVGAEALALARQVGDRQGIRMALFGLALTAARRGQLDRGREIAEEGLAVSREIGDLWFVSYFLWILATVANAAGVHVQARTYAEESLDVARELQAPLLLVCALDQLAAVSRAEGDDTAARARLGEAEEIARSSAIPDSYFASVLCALGDLAAAEGDADAALRRFEESLSLARGVGDLAAAGLALAGKAKLAEKSGALDDAFALASEALTLQLKARDELGVVRSLERLASVASRRNDFDDAARVLGATAALRATLGAPTLPWERDERVAIVETARHALGDAAFKAVTSEGRILSVEAAAAVARRES